MLAAPFKVLLDANVLYPFTLRDTLLRAASEGFFQIYWSAEILNEAVRNLVTSGTITAEQGARLRATMEGAFPEAEVTGYEPPHFRHAKRSERPARRRCSPEGRGTGHRDQQSARLSNPS